MPQPRGPHSVGFVDYGDKNVLARIYYPTKEKATENTDKWPQWASDDYILGLFTFIKAVTHRWPSWAPRGEYEHFDSIRSAAQWIPQNRWTPSLFRLVSGRVHVPIIDQAPLNTEQKWPVLVFSHGLGCARFTYSQICYDLASYGFIVIAPEHRDGSACLSYHIDPSGKKWAIPHRRIEWSEEEYFVRNRQLRERCHEVCQALNLATLLNDEPEKCENFEGDTNNEFFAMFKNTMDLSNPVMCGHSFGGATTLMALAAEPRFKVGIVLDGWLFPLRDEKDLAAKVKGKPIMFVNAESFLNEENLKKMETFRQEAGAESMSSQDIERICYYIKGSVHQNHIDAPFVIKVAKLRKMFGMHSDTCPDLVMSLNNKLMVHFIRKHLSLKDTTRSTQEEDTDDVQSFIEKNRDLLQEGFGTEHCQVKPPGCP